MKILFIGNSYTDQIQGVFKQVLANTPYADTECTAVWAGGVTLKRLINNGRAYKGIEAEKWDYVILQEQSQAPGLPGKSQQSFYDSVDTLVEKIRAVGAEPILYMTWGRIDGDEHHADLFPDYETMQKKLSEAYREAAQRNTIRLAPVGDAWAMVRKRDVEIGRSLYKKDGSHPSENGAFLAACVFLRVLFDASLDKVAAPEGMDEPVCSLLRGVVSGMTLPGKA